MRSCRWLFWVVASLLVLTGMVARPIAARPAKQTGAIRGRVSPAAAVSNGQVVFLLDGALVHPRVQRGAFSFKNVLPGTHVLSVVDPTTNYGAHRQFRVRAHSTAQVGTLDLIQGGRITGIVSQVDPSSGALTPLSGVQVTAEPAAVPLGLELPSLPPVPGGDATITAITADDGTYDMRGISPGYYIVTVVVPGLQEGFAQVQVTAGSTAAVDFQLSPVVQPGVGTVTGTVTDANGQAISGALVTITSPNIFYPVGYGTATGSVGPALIVPPPGQNTFSTLTDQNGNYTLNVPTGDAGFSATADGFQPFSDTVTVTANTTLTENVTLQADGTAAFGTIQGTVTDAKTGNPIAGASVDVVIPVPYATAVRNFYATTDSNGHYELDRIPAHGWPVRASADGYDTDTEKVSVIAGSTVQQDFQLNASTATKP